MMDDGTRGIEVRQSRLSGSGNCAYGAASLSGLAQCVYGAASLSGFGNGAYGATSLSEKQPA